MTTPSTLPPVGTPDNNPPVPLASLPTTGDKISIAGGLVNLGSIGKVVHLPTNVRQELVNYIAQRTGQTVDAINKIYSIGALGNGDGPLIDSYEGLVNGLTSVNSNTDNFAPSSDPLPWATSLAHFFSDIENIDWQRVGEVVIGVIFLSIATYGLVKNLGSSGQAAAGGTKSALGTVAKVANPLSSPNRKRRAITERTESSRQYAQQRSATASADRTTSRVTTHALREGARESAHQRNLETIHARGQYRKQPTGVDLSAPIL